MDKKKSSTEKQNSGKGLLVFSTTLLIFIAVLIIGFLIYWFGFGRVQSPNQEGSHPVDNFDYGINKFIGEADGMRDNIVILKGTYDGTDVPNYLKRDTWTLSVIVDVDTQLENQTGDSRLQGSLEEFSQLVNRGQKPKVFAEFRPIDIKDINQPDTIPVLNALVYRLE